MGLLMVINCHLSHSLINTLLDKLDAPAKVPIHLAILRFLIKEQVLLKLLNLFILTRVTVC